MHQLAAGVAVARHQPAVGVVGGQARAPALRAAAMRSRFSRWGSVMDWPDRERFLTKPRKPVAGKAGYIGRRQGDARCPKPAFPARPARCHRLCGPAGDQPVPYAERHDAVAAGGDLSDAEGGIALDYWQIGLLTMGFRPPPACCSRRSASSPTSGRCHGHCRRRWDRPCAGWCCWPSRRAYPLVILGAMLIGVGSAVFHPEASRVARTASGGRFGLAQSVFQVGGNFGTFDRAAAGGLHRGAAGARQRRLVRGDGAGGHADPDPGRALAWRGAGQGGEAAGGGGRRAAEAEGGGDGGGADRADLLEIHLPRQPVSPTTPST